MADGKVARKQSHVSENTLFSYLDKGCPTEKHQSVRDNTERHDGL